MHQLPGDFSGSPSPLEAEYRSLAAATLSSYSTTDEASSAATSLVRHLLDHQDLLRHAQPTYILDALAKFISSAVSSSQQPAVHAVNTSDWVEACIRQSSPIGPTSTGVAAANASSQASKLRHLAQSADCLSFTSHNTDNAVRLVRRAIYPRVASIARQLCRDLSAGIRDLDVGRKLDSTTGAKTSAPFASFVDTLQCLAACCRAFRSLAASTHDGNVDTNDDDSTSRMADAPSRPEVHAAVSTAAILILVAQRIPQLMVEVYDVAIDVFKCFNSETVPHPVQNFASDGGIAMAAATCAAAAMHCFAACVAALHCDDAMGISMQQAVVDEALKAFDPLAARDIDLVRKRLSGGMSPGLTSLISPSARGNAPVSLGSVLAQPVIAAVTLLVARMREVGGHGALASYLLHHLSDESPEGPENQLLSAIHGFLGGPMLIAQSMDIDSTSTDKHNPTLIDHLQALQEGIVGALLKEMGGCVSSDDIAGRWIQLLSLIECMAGSSVPQPTTSLLAVTALYRRPAELVADANAGLCVMQLLLRALAQQCSSNAPSTVPALAALRALHALLRGTEVVSAAMRAANGWQIVHDSCAALLLKQSDDAKSAEACSAVGSILISFAFDTPIDGWDGDADCASGSGHAIKTLTPAPEASIVEPAAVGIIRACLHLLTRPCADRYSHLLSESLLEGPSEHRHKSAVVLAHGCPGVISAMLQASAAVPADWASVRTVLGACVGALVPAALGSDDAKLILSMVRDGSDADKAAAWTALSAVCEPLSRQHASSSLPMLLSTAATPPRHDCIACPEDYWLLGLQADQESTPVPASGLQMCTHRGAGDYLLGIPTWPGSSGASSACKGFALSLWVLIDPKTLRTPGASSVLAHVTDGSRTMMLTLQPSISAATSSSKHASPAPFSSADDSAYFTLQLQYSYLKHSTQQISSAGKLKAGRWYHVAVCHSRPTTSAASRVLKGLASIGLSRAEPSGTSAQLFVNGRLESEGMLRYPNFGKNITTDSSSTDHRLRALRHAQVESVHEGTQVCIGGLCSDAGTHSTTHKGPSSQFTPLTGALSSVHLFDAPLTDTQLSALFHLGPGYRGALEPVAVARSYINSCLADSHSGAHGRSPGGDSHSSAPVERAATIAAVESLLDGKLAMHVLASFYPSAPSLPTTNASHAEQEVAAPMHHFSSNASPSALRGLLSDVDVKRRADEAALASQMSSDMHKATGLSLLAFDSTVKACTEVKLLHALQHELGADALLDALRGSDERSSSDCMNTLLRLVRAGLRAGAPQLDTNNDAASSIDIDEDTVLSIAAFLHDCATPASGAVALTPGNIKLLLDIGLDMAGADGCTSSSAPDLDWPSWIRKQCRLSDYKGAAIGDRRLPQRFARGIAAKHVLQYCVIAPLLVNEASTVIDDASARAMLCCAFVLTCSGGEAMLHHLRTAVCLDNLLSILRRASQHWPSCTEPTLALCKLMLTGSVEFAFSSTIGTGGVRCKTVDDAALSKTEAWGLLRCLATAAALQREDKAIGTALLTNVLVLIKDLVGCNRNCASALLHSMLSSSYGSEVRDIAGGDGSSSALSGADLLISVITDQKDPKDSAVVAAAIRCVAAIVEVARAERMPLCTGDVQPNVSTSATGEDHANTSMDSNTTAMEPLFTTLNDSASLLRVARRTVARLTPPPMHGSSQEDQHELDGAELLSSAVANLVQALLKDWHDDAGTAFAASADSRRSSVRAPHAEGEGSVRPPIQHVDTSSLHKFAKAAAEQASTHAAIGRERMIDDYDSKVGEVWKRIERRLAEIREVSANSCSSSARTVEGASTTYREGSHSASETSSALITGSTAAAGFKCGAAIDGSGTRALLEADASVPGAAVDADAVQAWAELLEDEAQRQARGSNSPDDLNRTETILPTPNTDTSEPPSHWLPSMWMLEGTSRRRRTVSNNSAGPSSGRASICAGSGPEAGIAIVPQQVAAAAAFSGAEGRLLRAASFAAFESVPSPSASFTERSVDSGESQRFRASTGGSLPDIDALLDDLADANTSTTTAANALTAPSTASATVSQPSIGSPQRKQAGNPASTGSAATIAEHLSPAPLSSRTIASATGSSRKDAATSSTPILSLPCTSIAPFQKQRGTFHVYANKIAFQVAIDDNDPASSLPRDPARREFLQGLFPALQSWEVPLPAVASMELRRSHLQPIALEFFFSSCCDNGQLVELDSTPSLGADTQAKFVVFGSSHERDKAIRSILRLKPENLAPFVLKPKVAARELAARWRQRQISNFDYLIALNRLAGRTYNDVAQYPILPWVIADYSSSALDLSNPRVFRDLSYPVAAQTPDRRAVLRKKFSFLREQHEENTRYDLAQQQRSSEDKSGSSKQTADSALVSDQSVFFGPPFHFGSCIMKGATVAWYLLRQEPFTSYHLLCSDGRFDRPDRQFHSIGEAWKSATINESDIKELTPHFFCGDGSFLRNASGLVLGWKQDGTAVDDVILPPWARDAADFVRINRAALECEHVSSRLHLWVDLVFGHKQRPRGLPGGSLSCELSVNAFHSLMYSGFLDTNKIKAADPGLYSRICLFMEEYGVFPPVLFPFSSVNAAVGANGSGSDVLGGGTGSGAAAAPTSLMLKPRHYRKKSVSTGGSSTASDPATSRSGTSGGQPSQQALAHYDPRRDINPSNKPRMSIEEFEAIHLRPTSILDSLAMVCGSGNTKIVAWPQVQSAAEPASDDRDVDDDGMSVTSFMSKMAGGSRHAQMRGYMRSSRAASRARTLTSESMPSIADSDREDDDDEDDGKSLGSDNIGVESRGDVVESPDQTEAQLRPPAVTIRVHCSPIICIHPMALTGSGMDLDMVLTLDSGREVGFHKWEQKGASSAGYRYSKHSSHKLELDARPQPAEATLRLISDGAAGRLPAASALGGTIAAVNAAAPASAPSSPVKSKPSQQIQQQVTPSKQSNVVLSQAETASVTLDAAAYSRLPITGSAASVRSSIRAPSGNARWMDSLADGLRSDPDRLSRYFMPRSRLVVEPVLGYWAVAPPSAIGATGSCAASHSCFSTLSIGYADGSIRVHSASITSTPRYQLTQILAVTSASSPTCVHLFERLHPAVAACAAGLYSQPAAAVLPAPALDDMLGDRDSKSGITGNGAAAASRPNRGPNSHGFGDSNHGQGLSGALHPFYLQGEHGSGSGSGAGYRLPPAAAIGCEDGSVLIHAFERGQGSTVGRMQEAPCMVLRGHTAPITAISACPAHNTLLTTSMDGSAVVWNLSNGTQRLRIRLPQPTQTRRANQPGRLQSAAAGVLGWGIVTSTRVVVLHRPADNTLWSFSAATGVPLCPHIALPEGLSPLAFCVSNDGSTLFIAGRGPILIVDVCSLGALGRISATGGSVKKPLFGPIASAPDAGCAYNSTSAACEFSAPITSLALSSHDGALFAGTADGELKIFVAAPASAQR